MCHTGFPEFLLHETCRHIQRFDTAFRGEFKHRIDHDSLKDGAKTPGAELELDRLVHDEIEGIVFEGQLDVVNFKQFCILPDQ